MARTRRKKKRPSKQDVAKARNRVLTNLGIDLAFDKVGDKLKSQINGIVNEYFSGEDFTGKAGMMKGLDHLVTRAFGSRGQLTGKDFSTAAWKGALAEGKDYYYGTDLGKTTVGKVGGSGLFAGVADAGAQLINKGDVDPVLTGAAMTKAGAKEGFQQYAAGAGLSKSAGAVGGAIGGGVVSGFADLYRTGSVSKSTTYGTMGAAIGSVVPGVGTVVGGLVGSAVGAFMDAKDGPPKPRWTITYDSPDGKDGIYRDSKTGKYKLAQPINITGIIGGGQAKQEIKLSPQQKAQLLQKRKKEMVQEVNRLESQQKEYDEMGAAGQLRHERLMSYYEWKAPQTEEELKALYRKQNPHSMVSTSDNLGTDLGYQNWRKNWDKNANTNWYVKGRMMDDRDTGINDPTRGTNRLGSGKLAQAQKDLAKKQGRFDPLKGWVIDEADPNAGSYQADQGDNQAMKELERKKRLGGTLTPTQEKALGIDSTKQLPSVGALGALGAKASDEDWTPRGMYGEEAELYKEETKRMKQGLFGKLQTGGGVGISGALGGMEDAGMSDSGYDASEQEGGWGSYDSGYESNSAGLASAAGGMGSSSDGGAGNI